MPPKVKTSQGAGETYADPGYKPDNVKRYALTKNGTPNEARIRAAYAYINMPKNQAGYTPAQVKAIKGRIMSAGRKLGIQYDADSK
jgi:hypothetical protein